uniref:Uncharacterized protein n=1 Tax=Anopheles merus TaxID=30066 RepID=A0A182V145_ANOME
MCRTRRTIAILTYEIIGMSRLCETIASVWQVPSGPKNAATPSQIISVMTRVATTVSPRVSFHRSASVTFGSSSGSLLISSSAIVSAPEMGRAAEADASGVLELPVPPPEPLGVRLPPPMPFGPGTRATAAGT